MIAWRVHLIKFLGKLKEKEVNLSFEDSKFSFFARSKRVSVTQQSITE